MIAARDRRGWARRSNRQWLAAATVLVCGLATATTAAAALTAWSVPAADTAAGSPSTSSVSCPMTTSSIVVVDFNAWGGNVEEGCAAGPGTEFAAMQEAGFTVAGVAGETQFVCRIDDEPPPTATPCDATPPVSAYWSFWYAGVGQDTWTYSDVGAARYRPPPGTLTAWVFGAATAGGSGRPPVTPTAVRATDTTRAVPAPTTTTSPGASAATTGAAGGPSTPQSSGSGTSAAGPGGVPAGGTSTGGGSAAPGAASSQGGGAGGTGSAAGSPTTSAPVTANGSGHPGAGGHARPGRGPRIVAVQPVSRLHRDASGSPVALVVGGAVILALVAVAGVTGWRRRRAG